MWLGPENYLAEGLADSLRQASIPVFGPSQEAAQLESSKIFCKEFMTRHRVPTAGFDIIDSPESLKEVLPKYQPPYVIKADGLAGGKGVYICGDETEALSVAEDLFVHKVLGQAGQRALIEQFQPGYEISFFILTNGKDYCALPLAQDHKRLLDGDRGPNTGGMGTVAPVDIAADEYQAIIKKVVEPTVEGIAKDKYLYRGVVFIGLMMTSDGPQVLEYNIRFGDPETQVLLPLMQGDWGQSMLEIANGDLPELQWSDQAVACVVLAAENYPKSPVKDVTIEGALEATEDGYILHAGTSRKGNQMGDRWGRVLNVIGTGDDLSSAIQASYRLADKIQWPGMQYRRDIGKQFYQV